MEATLHTIPRWFWITVVFALLMNLMGSAVFTIESLLSPNSLIETFGKENAEMILARPFWAKMAYATSFYGGLTGCAILILRKRLAVPILLISVIGMLVQQLYWWFGMDLLNMLRGADWIWPVITPTIPLGMYWLSLKARKSGWLV